MNGSLYRRVLLKLSGEALMGEQSFGVEHKACERIALSIKEIHLLGLEIGIVVGAGNIFRGNQAAEFGFSRTPADHIGMIATTINGLILQQSLAALGIESRVMSALGDAIVEKYVWSQAMHYLQKGIVVIFVGGTGNPYFTTDTAAALRANEIAAEIVVKATKRLNVMDATAIALCRENKIPIYVFNLFEDGALKKVLCSLQGGTLVTGD